MSKCFCHFNGFEVKDAYARRKLNELSNSIENVNKLAKVVDDISQMTNKDAIYVLTTDGNWYYYNDEEGKFVVGGGFMVNLGDVQVDYNLLNNNLKNALTSYSKVNGILDSEEIYLNSFRPFFNGKFVNNTNRFIIVGYTKYKNNEIVEESSLGFTKGQEIELDKDSVYYCKFGNESGTKLTIEEINDINENFTFISNSVKQDIKDEEISFSMLNTALKNLITNNNEVTLERVNDSTLKFKDNINGGIIKNNGDYSITITGESTNLIELEPQVLNKGEYINLDSINEWEIFVKLTSGDNISDEVMEELQKDISYSVKEETPNNSTGSGLKTLESVLEFKEQKEEGLYLIGNSTGGYQYLGILFKILNDTSYIYVGYVIGRSYDENYNMVIRTFLSNSESNPMEEVGDYFQVKYATLENFGKNDYLVTSNILTNFIGEPVEGNDGNSLSVSNLKTTNKTLVGAINEVLNLISTGGSGEGGTGLPTLTYNEFKTTTNKGLYIIDSGDDAKTDVGIAIYSGSNKVVISLNNGSFYIERLSSSGSSYRKVRPLNNYNLPSTSGDGFPTAKEITEYIGNKTNLQTNATNDIVSAINEVYSLVSSSSNEEVKYNNLTENLSSVAFDDGYKSTYKSGYIEISNSTNTIHKRVEIPSTMFNGNVNSSTPISIVDYMLIEGESGGGYRIMSYILRVFTDSISVAKNGGIVCATDGNVDYSPEDMYIRKIVLRK